MNALELPWGRLAFSDDAGDGPPVLFLHGSGCDSTDFDGVVASLDERVRVIRMDFRGHGDSGVPTEAFTIDDLADDVVALIEHLGLSDVFLVGHSLGGMVAMIVASRSPKVRAMALLEGWMRLSTMGAFEGERHFGRLDKAAIARIAHKSDETRHRIGPQNWSRFWKTVESFDGVPLLEEAAMDVFAIYGDMGTTLATRGKLLVPEKPNVYYYLIDEAGHYLPHEAPREVAERCLQLVRGSLCMVCGTLKSDSVCPNCGADEYKIHAILGQEWPDRPLPRRWQALLGRYRVEFPMDEAILDALRPAFRDSVLQEYRRLTCRAGVQQALVMSLVTFGSMAFSFALSAWASRRLGLADSREGIWICAMIGVLLLYPLVVIPIGIFVEGRLMRWRTQKTLNRFRSRVSLISGALLNRCPLPWYLRPDILFPLTTLVVLLGGGLFL